jgi:hypothetical protein
MLGLNGKKNLGSQTGLLMSSSANSPYYGKSSSVLNAGATSGYSDWDGSGVVGVTTDAAKSGLVGSLTHSLKINMIIKY